MSEIKVNPSFLRWFGHTASVLKSFGASQAVPMPNG